MNPTLQVALKTIWESKTVVFIRDHVWIFGLGILFIWIFFHAGPHFKELEYALARMAFVIFFIAVWLYAWWRKSVSEHIASGNLISDFKAVEAKHRLWFCFAVIALLAFIVVETTVHP